MPPSILYFVHYDKDTGSIVGLFTTEKHKVIPEPRITVQKQKRDEIVRRPGDFSVDVNTRQLIDTQASKNLVDELDYQQLAQDNHAKHNLTIARGAEVDGVYYYADDEASAHLTQCLTIMNADSNFEAMVKFSNAGTPEYKKVNKGKLVTIIKAVNALRLQAKDILLNG